MTPAIELKTSSHHYGFFLLYFAIFLIICVAAVFFLMKAQQATIYVRLTSKPQQHYFTYQASELDATIENFSIEDDFLYTHLSKKPKEAASKGVVTIRNFTSFTQSFTSGTRIISPQGIIFRLSENIDVPPKDFKDVAVHADKLGVSGDLGLTHFTFVTLDKSLQDLVYAENSKPMSGGALYDGEVTKNKVKIAKEAAVSALQQVAIHELKNSLQNEDIIINNKNVTLDTIEQTFSPEINKFSDAITVHTKAEGTAVLFNMNNLINLLNDAIDQDIKPEQMTINIYKNKDQQYTIAGSVNYLPTHATIEAINTSELTNKSKSDIDYYIRTLDTIELDSVRFDPGWTVVTPTNPEDITVQLL